MGLIAPKPPGYAPLPAFLFLFLSVAPAQTSGPGPYSAPGPTGGRPESHFRLLWSLDAALLWGGTVAQTNAQELLESRRPLRPHELDRIRLLPWDRRAAGGYSGAAAQASDWLSLGALVPAGLFALDAKRGESTWEEYAALLVCYGEALLLNSAVNLWVRSVVPYPRPYVFSSQAPAALRSLPEAAGSFYSGHASAAFITAVFTGYVREIKHPESPWNPWIWAGSLALASTVAGLRVAAGKHYPSDVLAGAAIGTLFGYLLPRLHLARPRPPLPEARSWRLSLLPGGLALALHF